MQRISDVALNSRFPFFNAHLSSIIPHWSSVSENVEGSEVVDERALQNASSTLQVQSTHVITVKMKPIIPVSALLHREAVNNSNVLKFGITCQFLFIFYLVITYKM